jgi:hypothetical protein
MTAERAVRILNREAGWDKWTVEEAARLLVGLRAVRQAERSAMPRGAVVGPARTGKTLATKNGEEARCG